ncbi:MAG TPA: acyltransferase [Myxococcota bacterium]|nr:acyltransferase [Myxococcota bacterium]
MRARATVALRRPDREPEARAPGSLEAGRRRLAEHVFSFDYLRVIAACGIVWFHADEVSPRRGIGYAGLPVFAAVAFFLLGRGVAKDSLGSFAAKRMRRLAVPFVAWSAFYTVERAVLNRGVELHAGLLDLLAGPEVHLWYLPFLLVASLAVAAVVRATRGSWLAYGSMSACGVWIFSAQALGAQLDKPLGQWWYALPAALFGLGLGHTRARRERWRFAALVTPAVLLLAWHSRAARPVDALSYALAIPLVVVATLFDLPRSASVERLSELTMGVYLLHPFVIDVCYKIGIASVPVRVGVGICGAALATAALRRTGLGRAVT